MQNSLMLFPIVAYILLSLTFYQRSGSRHVLEAIVKSHLILFAFFAISTELLSLINKVTFFAVLNTWLVFLVFGITLAITRHKMYSPSQPEATGAASVKVILIAAIALILTTTLFTAMLYPPNTWDSMTYHMPRVLHWISNENVSFYPTEIARQNYQMPLAEFAILHLQILTGGDWYANLVQWVSFFILVCMSILVAAELGLNKDQQITTAVVLVTLPMAILQASSTQNDIVVSAFLMSFALFMLRLRSAVNWENLVFAAISLGLALLTKGTAYLYGAALGISLALPILWESRQRPSQLKKVAAALTLIVIIALTFNAGHFSRNYQLYGHPLSTEVSNYRNQDMSLKTLESNILRNGALHLGTPYEQVNLFHMQFLNKLLGSRLNDPQTTWKGSSFSIPYTHHEDSAGNLIHMAIAVFAFFLLLISWYRGNHRKLAWYSVGLLIGAIGYCWVLKWQPWGSRLHTPLFVLAAPLLAVTITSGIAAKRIGYFVILLMVVYAVPFALDNSSRSIMSRDWMNYERKQLYFQNRSGLFGEYSSALDILKTENAREVGLYQEMDDWEYPLWLSDGETGTNASNFSFRPVGVNNISRTISEDVFLPSYVIATKPIEEWEHASKYEYIYDSNHIDVLRIIDEAVAAELR